MPYENEEQLVANVETVLLRVDGRVLVADRDTLVEEIVDELEETVLLTDAPMLQQAARTALWDLSQLVGVGYTPPDGLISAVRRADLTEFVFPMVEMHRIPYPMAKMVFAAAVDMEVGPLVFSSKATSAPDETDVATVLAAAIRENWQAPVLFCFPYEQIGDGVLNINWQDVFTGANDALPLEARREFAVDLSLSSDTRFTSADLERLQRMSFDFLDSYRDEIVEYYSDLFEDRDLNETFSLVKRFVIPASGRQLAFLSQL